MYSLGYKIADIIRLPGKLESVASDCTVLLDPASHAKCLLPVTLRRFWALAFMWGWPPVVMHPCNLEQGCHDPFSCNPGFQF